VPAVTAKLSAESRLAAASAAQSKAAAGLAAVRAKMDSAVDARLDPRLREPAPSVAAERAALAAKLEELQAQGNEASPFLRSEVFSLTQAVKAAAPDRPPAAGVKKAPVPELPPFWKALKEVEASRTLALTAITATRERFVRRFGQA
jgi:hypothetical protein